jgi:hypothetical protein
MGLIRILLAVIVAFLGAAAVDLVIFDKEIAVGLLSDAKTNLQREYEERIKLQAAEVLRRNNIWQAAENAAQCEANGKCGSGRANRGPIYQAAKQLANTLKEEYKAADSELIALKSEWEAKTKRLESTDISLSRAGLLTRLQALHDYITVHPMAALTWALFLGLMLLMELMVVIVKFAFKETVDDKLELIREEVSEVKGKSYLEALKSPVAGAHQLLATTYH